MSNQGTSLVPKCLFVAQGVCLLSLLSLKLIGSLVREYFTEKNGFCNSLRRGGPVCQISPRYSRYVYIYIVEFYYSPLIKDPPRGGQPLYSGRNGRSPLFGGSTYPPLSWIFPPFPPLSCMWPAKYVLFSRRKAVWVSEGLALPFNMLWGSASF